MNIIVVFIAHCFHCATLVSTLLTRVFKPTQTHSIVWKSSSADHICVAAYHICHHPQHFLGWVIWADLCLRVKMWKVKSVKLQSEKDRTASEVSKLPENLRNLDFLKTNLSSQAFHDLTAHEMDWYVLGRGRKVKVTMLPCELWTFLWFLGLIRLLKWLS